MRGACLGADGKDRRRKEEEEGVKNEMPPRLAARGYE